MADVISRSAELSPCGRYRYTLTRTLPGLFAGSGTCCFVMLNPSVADHTVDDQTIRQCLGFTQHWGFGRLLVVNLFAWRATLPRDMLAAIDPVGPAADAWILRAAREADLIVCAWGEHGRHRGRGEAVRQLLAGAGHRLHHLGLTATHRQPRHPLYLARETRLEEWT
ncbi:DUF1643 domain-containing protein [Coralloluteibacterium thermophilus]|uniref:DUF1643 domain-containing protein n=1 Tax=Coralloluteibacterium thermophilum TaxID=2707049 RepID=A0ABV9NJ93_9GAMM